MITSYKVRLAPSNKQETAMLQAAGAARWAYNYTIRMQQLNYRFGGKFISDNVIRKHITKLKRRKKYAWLRLVSSKVPDQAVKDACNAYKRFFTGQSRFPKYKSKKRSKISFYNRGDNLRITSTQASIERIGRVKLSEKSRIPYGDVTYYTPRVTFDGIHWYLSVGVETTVFQQEATGESLGIDLGIKALAIVSNGKVYGNINKTPKVKKLNKKLKRMQRQVSRKYLMNKDGDKFVKTKNISRLETKIRKQYIKLTNIRTNYRQQVTTEIAKTKPSRIVVEDLNVKGIMKNRHLSKAIAAQSFFSFTETLRYKCEAQGIEFVKADRWFPSSKTCSECGNIKKDLKLKDRVYNCDCCGKSLDRDLNASINLSRYSTS